MQTTKNLIHHIFKENTFDFLLHRIYLLNNTLLHRVLFLELTTSEGHHYVTASPQVRGKYEVLAYCTDKKSYEKQRHS